MNKYSYILTPNAITVVIAGRPYTMNSDNKEFEKAKETVIPLKAQDELTDYKLLGLFSPLTCLFQAVKTSEAISYSELSGELKFTDDSGIGHSIPSRLMETIIEVYNSKGSLLPFINFLTKLYSNPNKAVTNGLYEFMEIEKLVLTNSGDFIAYKSVNNDLTSIYDNKTQHYVGAEVYMNPETVCYDPNKACGEGLHFGSYEYAKSFGGEDKTMLMLRINPENVVAIPKHSSAQKGRTFRYMVIGIIEDKPKLTIVSEY